MKHSIRHHYEQVGVQSYYEQHGADYRNPHEIQIRVLLEHIAQDWALQLGSVLDLACGSGEVSLCLQDLGAQHIDGIDPYTGAAYLSRTGRCAEALTFEQIASGALLARRYSLIVCSFAMHLVPDSRLPDLAIQLALVAPQLLILTPHKRPILQEAWGWQLCHEVVINRVRARCYQSLFWQPD